MASAAGIPAPPTVEPDGNAVNTLLRDVPFFKTGDLSNSNVTFSMKASGGEQRIFDDFTLASGSAITTQINTLFSF